jgi:hypothetical protein
MKITMSSITTSGLKSFTLASVLAIATTLTFSAAANAASYTQGDFSAAFYPNVRTFTVDGCYVEVGVVFDTAGPNYRHWGAVRVSNCRSMHSYISTSVDMYLWDANGGSSWLHAGLNRNYIARNSSSGNGMGYTSKYCLYQPPAYAANVYWKVGAIVYTEHGSWWVESAFARDPNGNGC